MNIRDFHRPAGHPRLVHGDPDSLTLTEGYTQADRNRVARIATITVATVLIVDALSGETLLHWLSTSLGSFRVGGDIVLFLMALAIPLLAGPGAMSTVIIAMHRSAASYHPWMIIAIILLVALILLAGAATRTPDRQSVGEDQSEYTEPHLRSDSGGDRG